MFAGSLALLASAVAADATAQPAASKVPIARADVRCIAQHRRNYMAYPKAVIVYYAGDCPTLPELAVAGSHEARATAVSGMSIKRSTTPVYVWTKREIACLIAQYDKEKVVRSPSPTFTFQPKNCPAK